MLLNKAGSSGQTMLISNEVQDIIGYKPHWFIRKANVAFFLGLLLLLAFTWFIKYPDIIKGSLKLSAVNAPELLVVKSRGKLQKLLVHNEQEVVKGQPLAFLESSGNYQQVVDLQNWLTDIQPFIAKDSLEILLTHHLPLLIELGELQSPYQDFQSNLKEIMQMLSTGYYQQKKQALKRHGYYLLDTREGTQKQEGLIKQDGELQKIEYNANEISEEDKVIAAPESNGIESKMKSRQQTLNKKPGRFTSNNVATQNKKREIHEMGNFLGDQQQKFRFSFLALRNKLEEWKRQHLIVAPKEGKVFFASFLQENQLLVNGQEIFYIQSLQNDYYGQMEVSQTGLGKIQKGQKVVIRVDSYPSSEFGFLRGVVRYISMMPTNSGSFLVRVDLENGLTTNYNKRIFFRNSLSAHAEIVTDDRRLVERFLGELGNLTAR